MKIAVCDDEKYYREQVLEFINSCAFQNKSVEITVTVFSHADELLKAVYKNGGFDIYILDIIMPDMNGIELGEKLRENGFNEKIIYLTSSPEFAVDSYKVEAFNYILKPFDENNFLLVLNKAISDISNKKEKYILVKTKEHSVKINFDTILYAELVKRNIIYHLTDGKRVESNTLRTKFAEAMQTLLRDERFILCGASRILNMNHIAKVESEAISFDNSDKIFVNKKICRNIRTSWVDFCFREVENS